MSILLWAAGIAKNWATSKVAKYIESAYNDQSLEGQLYKTVEVWLKANSFDKGSLEALFNWYHKEAIPQQVFRKELSDTILKENKIPTQIQWEGALVERYQEIRSIRKGDDYLLPLFELPLEKIEILFNDLANKLHWVCVQNLQLFTTTTHFTLQQILSDIQKLLAQRPSQD